MDQLICSLQQRTDAYREVREVFEVVKDFNTIDADQIGNMQFEWQIHILETC